jgi:type II secretory pathway pseudopilin PulG
MRRRRTQRGGFSLLEAVVVVLALALSVPATVAWLGESAARRADAVNALRASALATTVMETVMADAASDAPGLGFAAFENTAAYLDTARTGLRARIAPLTRAYTDLGFSYEVTFSALVDATGNVNTNPAMNLFRRVTVTVSYSSAQSSTPIRLSVEALVADL